MRAFFSILFLSLFVTVSTWGQISRGGIPQEIVRLKSSVVSVIDMPRFNAEMRLNVIEKEQTNKSNLKPFKFAHAFQVSLTTNNSGDWYDAGNGYFIWKLKIRSKDAKSINLIFHKFELPTNAKLFVFNEKENYTLGAFTSLNNKPSGKFAVSPVIGDEITIQYEIPSEYINEEHFEIKSVNHDFIGILDSNERRPMGVMAGACNIDINCDLGSDWKDVKNSVCRLIVNGIEICTGTLVNNTAENQKPYVLSAGHCYDRWDLAETTVYVFNYESPYCAPLDGDPSNSISGALMKAQFDSMDFALAELSLIPPPEFRPYYAGWERSINLPDTTVSIHHPKGDIKKIAIDKDAPVITNFNNEYTKNGFLRVLRWDEGVTEVGSSGGPLFNTDKNIIGTLTGGLAICSNPIDDYFERFSMSWDYKTDSTKQLKYWLDPLNLNEQNLAGTQFYEGVDLCGSFTNLTDNDSHGLVSLIVSEQFSGYWGGTNNVGITEFVEQYSIFGNEQLSGISLGVGIIDKNQSNTQSQIKIKVYNGNGQPETLIYSKDIFIKDLVQDAMNFIGFDEIVEPADTFFVGFELSNMLPLDTFTVYQSLRAANTENFFYFKENGVWQNFKEANLGYNSMVNVFELVACNVEDTLNDIPIVVDSMEILVYPNPTQSVFTIEFGSDIIEDNISVYNLIGQNIEVQISKVHLGKMEIDLSGNIPGVYFVRLKTATGFVSKKVSFVPW